MEVTAISFHAYAYVADRYALLPHGASMGDGYGPILVARRFEGEPLAWLAGKRIAVPGTRTSAFLALRLFARGSGQGGGAPPAFETVVTPFDRIMALVASGQYDGGLLIHEGQLTYQQAQSGSLRKVVDLGAWWKSETGLPLPLGGNAIRKDLAPEVMTRVSHHIRASIQWGLEHRGEALQYALKHARGLDSALADQFVGMYVNQYTLEYGSKGREAVAEFIGRGRQAGYIESPLNLQWCE